MKYYCLVNQNDPEYGTVLTVRPDIDLDNCPGVVAVPEGWGPQVEGAKDMNVTADIFIGCLLVICLIGGWIAGGQR